MKKRILISGLSLVCAVALFAACGNQQGTDDNENKARQSAQGQTQANGNSMKGQNASNQGQGQAQGQAQQQQQGSTIRIPSYDAKEHTDHGSTSVYDNNKQIMGSSVYSMIGSSGLHDGGVSAHLQSRLGGSGINGINVLVIDDTVILAQTSNEMTSTHYDPMQDKLLNPTSGTSATGVAKRGEPAGAEGGGTEDSQNGTYGTSGTNDRTDNNLDEAYKQIQAMFGGNVKILHVTDSASAEAINRIKEALKSPKGATDTVAKDIAFVLKKATE